MAKIKRENLFNKLNQNLYKALERSTTFCKMRGNPYIELVHWIYQIYHEENNDMHKIFEYFDINSEQFEIDLIQALEQLPRDATSISDISSHIDDAVEKAWSLSSIVFSDQIIRSSYLIISMLQDNTLKHMICRMSNQFEKIDLTVLSNNLATIVKGSSEQTQHTLSEDNDVAASIPQSGGKSTLAQYGIDLTQKARNDEIDPVLGRDDEIRKMIDILLRRRQNNPLLTGEAGVGKTAIVEGLALKIANNDVPDVLANVRLISLDIGLLQAGAGVKGEFESRLKKLIDEVESSETPIILFVDEIHTLIGAGGSAGTGDAANLLKPALARGQLRTIGATTWTEYKKHIEKDPALTRRFQVIQVMEPTEEQAIIMLRGIADKLANHHQVFILDEAIDAAVRLSHRYIPSRQLPDKAIALLDTTCARVFLSQQISPSSLEKLEKEIFYLKTEHDMLTKEQQMGQDRTERLSAINKEIKHLEKELNKFQGIWNKELELNQQLLAIQKELLAQNEQERDADDTKAKLAEIKKIEAELLANHGSEPLISSSVDANAIATVVADWTGIPVGRMVKDEMLSILSLTDTIAKRVIGQDHALNTIVQRIQSSKAGLTDPKKPHGVFLLCGPSGVGKTETALALAEALFGGEQNLITINMSEFQESHTVSTLKGAPPGYVGYGEGGVLTEAVRRKPYSVVLLDEIEKAHPDVHEIFFQVFDKGEMEDGEGQYIDFKNTIIILTTNVGADTIMKVFENNSLVDEDALISTVRKPLLRTFPAALLGRLTIVPYYPLSDEILSEIINLQINLISERLHNNHNIKLKVNKKAIDLIINRCTEIESGARMVYSILTNNVLPQISKQILLSNINGELITSIKISADKDSFTYKYEYEHDNKNGSAKE